MGHSTSIQIKSVVHNFWHINSNSAKREQASHNYYEPDSIDVDICVIDNDQN